MLIGPLNIDSNGSNIVPIPAKKSLKLKWTYG